MALANAQTAFNLVKDFESAVMRNGYHVAYDDANPTRCWNGVENYEQFRNRCVGTPTIGYGITDKTVVSKLKITQHEADKLLIDKTVELRWFVLQKTKVPLNHYQREALVSFVFNVGRTNYVKSTLLKKLNAGDYDSVPKEMKRWKYGRVNGKSVVLQGLSHRREKESTFFNIKPK